MTGRVYRGSRWCARVFLRTYNRLRAIDADHVPHTGAAILVANHASHLDPPAVGCLLTRPVRYLARASLRRLPIVGPFLAALGTLFVERDGHARAGIDISVGALERGELLCLFPEGTRTRDGRVGEFKRGLLLILRRCPAQVVPAGVVGTYRALPRGRFFPRPARCEVRYGEPMSAAEVLAPGGLDELRRRVMALAGDLPEAPVRSVDAKPRRANGGALPSAAGCSAFVAGEVNESRPTRTGRTGPGAGHVRRDVALAVIGVRADVAPADDLRLESSSVSCP